MTYVTCRSMTLQDGLLRDEVLTVADAVAAVATATGVTVPVSTTATTRECSMKTSVTDAMETRRERIGKGKKEGAVLGRYTIYADRLRKSNQRAVASKEHDAAGRVASG